MKTRLIAIGSIFILVGVIASAVYSTYISAPESVPSGVEYSIYADTQVDNYDATTTLVLYKDGSYFADASDSGYYNVHLTCTETDYGNKSVLWELFADDGGSSESVSATVNVILPNQAPVGSFESASNSAIRGQTITASGWAADLEMGAPVSRVDYYIDGNLVGQASLGGSRPDIQAAKSNWSEPWPSSPRNLTSSGWNLAYSTSGLAAGTHSIRVVAVDNQNLATDLGTKYFSVTVSASGSSSLRDYQIGTDPNNRRAVGQSLDWMIPGLNSGSYGSPITTENITLEYSQECSGTVRLFVVQPNQ